MSGCWASIIAALVKAHGRWGNHRHAMPSGLPEEVLNRALRLVKTSTLMGRGPVAMRLKEACTTSWKWSFTHHGHKSCLCPLMLSIGDLDYLRNSPEAILVFTYLAQSLPHGGPAVQAKAIVAHKLALQGSHETTPDLLASTQAFVEKWVKCNATPATRHLFSLTSGLCLGRSRGDHGLSAYLSDMVKWSLPKASKSVFAHHVCPADL